MPLYMDIHRAGARVTREDVVAAIDSDGARHDGEARLLRYWYHLDSGSVFCLIEAPHRAAAQAVHAEPGRLHLTATMEVQEGR